VPDPTIAMTTETAPRPAVPPECIVKQGEDWMLVSPVPEPLAKAAAEYSVTQRATLNRIVGLPEVRRDVLGHRIRPDRICIALVRGEVAGCISYRMDGKGSVWPEAARFRRRFGPVGGTARYLLTEATLRRGRPDELYLEGFKVETKARGRGIGTALLHWLGDEVVRQGKQAWRTEASITADAAMRVYQGVGAQAIKTVSLGPLGPLFDRHKFVVLRWEPAAGPAAEAVQV
jgi:GNAT superfamily N-acetyltransferase